MNEKAFNKKLIKGFTAIKLRSFESCRLPDVPDLHAIVGRGIEFWIETKVITSDKTKLPFRHGQPAWAQKMSNDGGIYFVVVVFGDCVHLLHSEKTIHQLAAEPLRYATGWDWGFVRLSERGWIRSLEAKILRALNTKFPPRSPQEKRIKTLLRHLYGGARHRI